MDAPTPNEIYGRTNGHASYVLRLYISGNNPRSHNAIVRLHDICDTYLDGHYQFEVVDISRQADLARREQIIATPTLVKYLPKPRKIWVGDLTNTDRILAGMGLPTV
jgi:circadian clock protein KaiB